MLTINIVTGNNNNVAITPAHQKRDRWGWLTVLLRKALGVFWTPAS